MKLIIILNINSNLKKDVGILTSEPQNVTLLGNGYLEKYQVKMRLLGWALIQYAPCPYKKGN